MKGTPTNEWWKLVEDFCKTHHIVVERELCQRGYASWERGHLPKHFAEAWVHEYGTEHVERLISNSKDN